MEVIKERKNRSENYVLMCMNRKEGGKGMEVIKKRKNMGERPVLVCRGGKERKGVAVG
jgi:hypothetical protein